MALFSLKLVSLTSPEDDWVHIELSKIKFRQNKRVLMKYVHVAHEAIEL